jgi:hypothetical protein
MAEVRGGRAAAGEVAGGGETPMTAYPDPLAAWPRVAVVGGHWRPPPLW